MAAVSLVLPAGAVAITGLSWLGRLPAQLAFHWSASGRPDGFFATEPLFWVAFGASSLFSCIGLAVLLIPSRDHEDTVKSVTVVGTVSAFVASAWIVPAAATYTSHSADQAALGGWLFLFVAALAYGVIPRLLTSRRSRVSG
ncbi:hypothetical protein GCM10010910_15780 [Microbacterium nanhaiense]|uniref:DUF1648 domain-containing protein n=1 Tax=Microbacterium nanhaiense TaxID=1301026 RepID=A0ABQ2N286_9MICO|nr:hypothetical protein GCM10010910_15780 [Microbacterium nanhaiense]